MYLFSIEDCEMGFLIVVKKYHNYLDEIFPMVIAGTPWLARMRIRADFSFHFVCLVL